MKILVRNGRVEMRLPVPRGIKVQAFVSGLFVSGLDFESRFDFGFLNARGFCVEPMRTCSEEAGYLVSWYGRIAGGNQWFIVCE